MSTGKKSISLGTPGFFFFFLSRLGQFFWTVIFLCTDKVQHLLLGSHDCAMMSDANPGQHSFIIYVCAKRGEFSAELSLKILACNLYFFEIFSFRFINNNIV